jgi:hypothetical protein
MVPRVGSPRRTFDLRLRGSMVMVTGLLVLFGFFLAHFAQG